MSRTPESMAVDAEIARLAGMPEYRYGGQLSTSRIAARLNMTTCAVTNRIYQMRQDGRWPHGGATKARRPRRACDLCGVMTAARRRPDPKHDIKGYVCVGCFKELEAEYSGRRKPAPPVSPVSPPVQPVKFDAVTAAEIADARRAAMLEKPEPEREPGLDSSPEGWGEIQAWIKQARRLRRAVPPAKCGCCRGFAHEAGRRG